MTPTASPCIGTCLLDPDTAECIGCYRNIKEIQTWSKYSEEEKQKAMIRIRNKKRRQVLDIRNKYNGR